MSLIFNEEGMYQLFGRVDGPLANHVARWSKKVEVEAQRITGGSGGVDRPRKRTGDLQGSIRSYIVSGVPTPGMPRGGVYGVISAGDEQTITHHDRDYPVRIELGGVASFTWRRGARAGTPGQKYYRKPYLVPALRRFFPDAVVHRNG